MATSFPGPPTEEELENAIIASAHSGILDDCRRIVLWIDANTRYWPPPIVLKGDLVKAIASELKSMIGSGKHDRLIHRHHLTLWGEVRAINRAIDEPLVKTGRTIKAAQRAGHEKVHGTKEQKDARKAVIVGDFNQEISNGTKRTAAYALVGEKHQVSAKTVQRYVKSLDSLATVQKKR